MWIFLLRKKIEIFFDKINDHLRKIIFNETASKTVSKKLTEKQKTSLHAELCGSTASSNLVAVAVSSDSPPCKLLPSLAITRFVHQSNLTSEHAACERARGSWSKKRDELGVFLGEFWSLFRVFLTLTTILSEMFAEKTPFLLLVIQEILIFQNIRSELQSCSD